MKKNNLMLLVVLLCATTTALAQEFNAQVKVNNTAGTKLIDPRVYKNMEVTIKDLIDNRRWTEDAFKNEERINLNINITIKEEVSTNTFKADFAVQATRPVLNSGYESVLMTFVDKDVIFDFQENASLDFNEVSPSNNLSGVCGFYAFVALGMDYDSFSSLGGQPYFQKAQVIVNAMAPSEGRDKNWKPITGDRQRTRYWVLQSLLNPRATAIRKALYDYYINGLDLMSEKPTEAQVNIADAIDRIGKVSRDLPGAMVLQMFVDAKNQEIVQMFAGTPATLRSKVSATMLTLDAVNAQRYTPLGR
jgi:Domain of unknown function (DUF4835)